MNPYEDRGKDELEQHKPLPDFGTIFIDGLVKAPKLVSSGAHFRIKSAMENLQNQKQSNLAIADLEKIKEHAA